MSEAYFGSSLFVFSKCDIGAAFSVLGDASFCSSVSVLHYVRLGSTISVLGNSLAGSQMILVSLTTLKGDFSVDGASNKVSTEYLQVAGKVELTSSLSVLVLDESVR